MAGGMNGKREAQPAAARPAHTVHFGLAACLALLVVVIWQSSARGPVPLPHQPQQAALAAAHPGHQFVGELTLNLDVGSVAQQAEADAWCAVRPPQAWPASPDQLRQLRVAIVMEPVCRRQEYVDPELLAVCLDALMNHCPDLARNGCFGGHSKKINNTECKGVLPPEGLIDEDGVTEIRWSYYQRWWQTVMTQITPELRGMGWENIKILSDKKSASERRMASCADILITSTSQFWQLYALKHGFRPKQKLVLIEQYGAGTFMIPMDMESVVESNNTLAVVKNVVVSPSHRQNGPLLEERAHLALMAKHIPNGSSYLTMKEGHLWTLPTMEKMIPLLPMSMRFANPLHCGGGWNFVRYRGFFTKDQEHWPIPPLAEREYDVTFIGKLEYEGKAEVSGVTAHRHAAVKALSAFRDKWGKKYKVYVPQGERLEYHEYIGLLKKSKLVLSPWGWGEWSHKDFEILMAGCVVIKPRVDIFKIYPPIFEHNQTCISVREDFSDLEAQILPLLRDTPRAQRMATRQQGVWRHYARPEVVAKDWDTLLINALVNSSAAPEEQQQQQRLEDLEDPEEEFERLEDLEHPEGDDAESQQQEQQQRMIAKEQRLAKGQDDEEVQADDEPDAGEGPAEEEAEGQQLEEKQEQQADDEGGEGEEAEGEDSEEA